MNSGIARGPCRTGGALLLALLVVATALMYRGVGSFEYVLYDDEKYVTANPMVSEGITRKGLIAAFTREHASNWHPLTWLSHMFDVQVFGKGPGWPHRINLLLHIANTVLLAIAVAAMTGRFQPGIAIAGLFAVHPLHVESVAWISERKDVLSAFFWMLALLAYSAYVRRRTVGRYLALTFFFGCGLLAKQMVVTLPFVLLLLDYWPLGRVGVPARRSASGEPGQTAARALLEKLPLLAMSAAASVVTLRVQREAMFTQVPLVDRVANALVSVVAYLWKMLLPSGLTVYYPFPPSPRWLAVAIAGLLIAGLTIVVLRRRRENPFLPVGWLWYLGTLVPVIGLVQVGGQAMADRYTYLPSIGILLAVVWSAVAIAARSRAVIHRLAAACIITVGLLAGAGRDQVMAWENSGTLFSRSLQVNPDDWLAHVNLGIFLKRQGNAEAAVAHYREALRLRPGRDEISAEILYNMGNALAMLQRFDQAAAYFREAVALKPADPEMHANLAAVLQLVGRRAEAARHLEEARRLAAAREAR